MPLLCLHTRLCRRHQPCQAGEQELSHGAGAVILGRPSGQASTTPGGPQLPLLRWAEGSRPCTPVPYSPVNAGRLITGFG